MRSSPRIPPVKPTELPAPVNTDVRQIAAAGDLVAVSDFNRAAKAQMAAYHKQQLTRMLENGERCVVCGS